MKEMATIQDLDSYKEVFALCSQWSGFGSSKAGRGLATKLHPHLIGFGSSKVGRGLATKLHLHLIALGEYRGMEVEQ